MSSAALLLVVLAAFIHATWNLLSKRAAAAGPSFIFAYNFVACVVYAPWVAWIFASGELTLGGSVLVCIALSGLIHLAYSLALQRGYQVADLSVVYPIARGSGPMLSSLGAFLVLRETPTLQGVCGLLAVVMGIALISTQGDLSAFRRSRGHLGVRWGILTGAFIAMYTVVDAYGVKTLGIQPVVLDWLANVLRFFLLAPVVLQKPRRTLERMQNKWLLAVGVGVLSPLSYILVLAALDMGAPLSVVAPTREMSMMIGAVFGMVILREPIGVWRLGGCAILVLGVVLLGWS